MASAASAALANAPARSLRPKLRPLNVRIAGDVPIPEAIAQAKLGGMVSSVARINSVGMRVMLRQLPRTKAVTAILHNLMNWRELDCQAMFPKCSSNSSSTSSSSSNMEGEEKPVENGQDVVTKTEGEN